MTKKICISGYYGFDNFGDETILNVLVKSIKNFETNTEITVFSSKPEKTSKRLDVNSINSFNIKEVISSLIKSDCLISGGGSLLQDVTSAKSLIYYLGIITLAQLFKKKTIIFAQGIGPINNKKLEKLTAFILKRASNICVRDDNSLELLKNWNINAIKCSDPVWNLTIPAINKTNKIGIQLRDCDFANEEFLNKFANSISKAYSKKEIVLLSLQNKLDLDICKKLEEKIKQNNPEIKISIIENTSNEKVIEDIASLDELIAMRFHACLVAIKAGVKVLPISYDIKVEKLAEEFNLSTIKNENISDLDEIINNFKDKKTSCDKNIINSHNFNFKVLESII